MDVTNDSRPNDDERIDAMVDDAVGECDAAMSATDSGESEDACGDEEASAVIVHVAFSLTGPLRFLSHQEFLDLWIRAAMRAKLPMAFSQGFNPRARIRLPLPKSVGIACEGDLLRLELSEAMPMDALMARLAAELPSGLTLTSAEIVEDRGFPQAVAAEWQIDVRGFVSAELAERVSTLASASAWMVSRTSHKTRRTTEIDLRAYVTKLELAESLLHVGVTITPGGTIRPAELFGLLGLPTELASARLRRTSIVWA
jgi:radical SAM-linked protein